MPLRVGILSTAHLHVWSYESAFRRHSDSTLIGLWDDDAARGEAFAQKTGLPFVGYLDDLLANVDAVVICSENVGHAELAVKAAAAGKHILCEKPLATTIADGERMIEAADRARVKFMTAFPCRFSPAYARLKERVKAGEIGRIRGICATNRGRCPFGWFVDKERSGGGAMIDHVVHVADLLRDLLGEEPVRVQAQTGSNMYGQAWEDTAMLTLDYPSGVFATLDSSWSRPQSFKTWGDVTMNMVGDSGVIELDMFGPAVDVYSERDVSHVSAGYGSDMDALAVDAFIRACREGTPVPVTGEDGLAAVKVALAGYRSAADASVATV